jgi:hypothetical protein
MDVCVVCVASKDKRHSQDNQDKEVVQMKYRERERERERESKKKGRYSDSLRTERSVDRIPVEARFSATFQTGPGALFPGGKAAGAWR